MRSPNIAFLLSLACLLCAVVHPSTAIHEDEQGLRDWILRFVGHVEHVTFYPELRRDHVYVTSSQGVVASLSLSDGELQWRKLLSTAPACIVASREGVVVSSPAGTVYILNTVTGALETTFKLILSTGASVTACAADTGGKVKVAAMDATKAYLYELDTSVVEEEIYVTASIPIGEAAHEVRISGTHLWVLRPKGADRYSLSGNLELQGVGGGNEDSPIFISTAANDEAVVSSATKVVEVKRSPTDESVQDTMDCSRCGSGVLLGSNGVFEGRVTTQVSTYGFTVTFPVSKVYIPYNGSAAAAPTVLMAVRDVKHGTRVILRASNGHLLAVGESGGIIWERWEGLSSLADTVIVDNPLHNDHFSFTKLAVGISTYGVVYAIPVADMGSNIRILVDASDLILQKTRAVSIDSVKMEKLLLSGGGGTNIINLVTVSGSTRATLSINITTGAVEDVKVCEDALFIAPTFEVRRSLEVHGNITFQHQHFFTANLTSGHIEGYFLSTSSTRAIPLWTVRMPYPLVAYTTGENPLQTSVVNNLRVFLNTSSKTEEVRRKFPTRNVLVVAHYEPSDGELTTLVITAIDTITGGIQATMRHRNVEGNVHMLLVEHTVVYYYMDAVKMRHCLGVWEMFEDEYGPPLRKDAGATLPLVITSMLFQTRRVFSSRATRPPLVTGAVLGVYGGNLAAIGVTTSFNSIARKSIVLAFESGRVATVELGKLLSGGQLPVDDKGNQLTHLLIPSTSFVTHKFRVAKPRLITTEPTNLESSCHLLVSGLDLFYVRASSGKAFDLLNSDFNKNLLIILTCSFGILSLVARYFVMRKGLYMLWK